MAGEKEDAIVAAYLAGRKMPDIQREFGVGADTIRHILRRSGKLPGRTHRKMGSASKDAALAGLYELIKHQDHRIIELEETVLARNDLIARLQRQLQRRHNDTPPRGVGKKNPAV